MKIAICVENSGGLLFNGRRLSQDKAIPIKLSDLAGNGKIYLNKYSSDIFEKKDNLCVFDDFTSRASKNDICFIENTSLPDMKDVSTVYLFKWNRNYPADKYFSYDLLSGDFKKVKTKHFVGNSHKKVTLEIYERRYV